MTEKININQETKRLSVTDLTGRSMVFDLRSIAGAYQGGVHADHSYLFIAIVNDAEPNALKLTHEGCATILTAIYDTKAQP